MSHRVTICLTMAILLSACQSTTQPTADFTIVGTGGNTIMVVVDSKTSTDRAALQGISKSLCGNKDFCYIWFWDDLSKAPTTVPLTDAQDQAIIATYGLNKSTGYEQLLVCSLGDC